MAKPMTTKDKIREWISDNLRYMLLIGAILLIVAAVLLIVHLVSPKNDGKSSGGTVTSSSTGNNVPDKKTQVKATAKQILRTAQAFHRTFRIPRMIPVQMLPVPIPPARRMQRLSRQVSRKRQTIPVIQRIPIIRLSPLPRTMSRK